MNTLLWKSREYLKSENQYMKTLLIYPSAVISIPAMNPKERLEKNGPLGALLPSSHPKNTSGNQLMTQRVLGTVVLMQADRMTAEAQVTTSTRVLRTPHGHRLFVNVSTVTVVAEVNLTYERYSTRFFFPHKSLIEGSKIRVLKL